MNNIQKVNVSSINLNGHISKTNSPNFKGLINTMIIGGAVLPALGGALYDSFDKDYESGDVLFPNLSEPGSTQKHDVINNSSNRVIFPNLSEPVSPRANNENKKSSNGSFLKKLKQFFRSEEYKSEGVNFRYAKNPWQLRTNNIFNPGLGYREYDEELDKLLNENGIYYDYISLKQYMVYGGKYKSIVFDFLPYEPKGDRYTIKEKEAILDSLQDGYTGELKTKQWLKEREKLVNSLKDLEEVYGITNIYISSPCQGQSDYEISISYKNGEYDTVCVYPKGQTREELYEEVRKFCKTKQQQTAKS